VNHDLDDAMRAGVLRPGDVPDEVFSVLGRTHSQRITALVVAVLDATDLDRDEHVHMEAGRLSVMEVLRKFLFEEIYANPATRRELAKARTMLEHMWEYFTADLERFRSHFLQHAGSAEVGLQHVTDFIAGMTDAYAVDVYEKLFVPRRWYIV
jgi:dGTPase